MLILPKVIQKFGEDRIVAAKSELKQMHDRTCFWAMAVSELVCQEKERALDGLMFVTQKKSGEHKGHLVHNGKSAREWVSRENKSSPICFAESIMLTCTIDTIHRRNILSLDIPNSFIQADMPKMKKGKHIVMKLHRHLITSLVEIDAITY